MTMADLDGDADLDVLLGNFAAPSQVYLSNGGNFIPAIGLSGSARLTTSVAVGDLNGDSALDLLEMIMHSARCI